MLQSIRESFVSLNSQAACLYNPNTSWKSESLASLYTRILAVAIQVFSQQAIYALDTISVFFTKNDDKDEGVKTSLTTIKNTFIQQIKEKGSIAKVELFIQTTAGSKKFTVKSLNEIDPVVQELIEKTTNCSILLTAACHYTDDSTRACYTFKDPDTSVGSNFRSINFEKAKEVADARQLYYKNRF